jgi:hypothetical protein
MVRFKHRYLLVHLVFPDQLQLPSPPSSSTSQPALANSDTKSPQASLTESGLIGLLRDSLSVNFGDIGAGEVGGTFSSTSPLISLSSSFLVGLDAPAPALSQVSLSDNVDRHYPRREGALPNPLGRPHSAPQSRRARVHRPSGSRQR